MNGAVRGKNMLAFQVKPRYLVVLYRQVWYFKQPLKSDCILSTTKVTRFRSPRRRIGDRQRQTTGHRVTLDLRSHSPQHNRNGRLVGEEQTLAEQLVSFTNVGKLAKTRLTMGLQQLKTYPMDGAPQLRQHGKA